jgi:hypothetical protein
VLPVVVPFHVYVKAPPAVKFATAPVQTKLGVAFAATTTRELTTTATVLLDTHVFEVPLTNKTKLKVGLTVKLDAFDPVFQVYVDAPLTETVAIPPGHTVTELATRTGSGTTLTFTATELEQVELNPVSV